MGASVISGPGFRRGQKVRFAGGEGTVQSYKSEAGTWAYQVEMAMGREPEFGRIGYETTVVLSEADLEASESNWSACVAIA